MYKSDWSRNAKCGKRTYLCKYGNTELKKELQL